MGGSLGRKHKTGSLEPGQASRERAAAYQQLEPRGIGAKEAEPSQEAHGEEGAAASPAALGRAGGREDRRR